MIKVKGLNKYFKSFHALKGIDLHVGKGEIYGFIGHNGAGKSTTINILAGLSRPSSGQCIVNGIDVQNARPGELGIGYLPEEPKFYPWLTAYETLEYLGSGKGNRASKQQIDGMLEWAGLKDSASRRVGGFSRGMRQRLGIAAALIRDPELLLFDEPSSALDPEGRMDVLNLIKDLKGRGKTVFFSTHILDDVERVCDRVGILADGRLVLEKPLETLLSENISPVYDIELKQADETLASRLESIKGVISVSANGNKLAVTVSDPYDSKALLEFLSQQSVPVISFALRKNSLEDIFISEVSQNGYDAKH
jgi:ABC-2 type transport system ATP-binding protein